MNYPKQKIVGYITKTKKWVSTYPFLILTILVIFSAFYWFQLRPSLLTKKCHAYAQDNAIEFYKKKELEDIKKELEDVSEQATFTKDWGLIYWNNKLGRGNNYHNTKRGKWEIEREINDWKKKNKGTYLRDDYSHYYKNCLRRHGIDLR